MPRNISGSYTLPAGNPVVAGTDIESVWANDTMEDLAAEVTNSLDRNGRGAMLAQLKAFAGTVTAPGYGWNLEPRSGWYRAGTGDFRFAIDGVDAVRVTSAGIVSVVGNVPITTPGAGAYQLALTDIGRGVYKTDAANITIPAIATVAFVPGDIISGINENASSQTIVAAGGVTIRLAGTSTTGNRTVAAYGSWTAWMVANDLWYVSGNGVT